MSNEYIAFSEEGKRWNSRGQKPNSYLVKRIKIKNQVCIAYRVRLVNRLIDINWPTGKPGN